MLAYLLPVLLNLRFHHSIDNLVTTCYMRVIGTTLLQVHTWPSGPSAFTGLSPTFSKEECIQTVRSPSYAW